VRARCRVTYRMPLFPGVESILSHLQARLSARIAVLINTAPDPRTLEARRSEHETGLLPLALEALRSVRTVQLHFAPAGDDRPAG
jgi:hypothetical protein